MSSSSSSSEPAELIRAELFSIERLEQHAESLANAQRVTQKRFKGRAILKRVKDNNRVLIAARHQITQSIRDERSITPAGEWFVDNFHVIEEQILEIHDDLPPKFYRGLPKLTDGFLKGTPRVYGVAWAFTAHTDSRFDPDWLRRFVRAYQRVDPLSIGEIWALAISLRIVLVENLRRLVDRLLHSKAERFKADALADSLLGLKESAPSNLGEALRPFEKEVMDKSFAVQLVLRLRDQGESIAPVLQWLDKLLEAQGTLADDIIRMEHQEQAAMNTTARNIITSMRLVSALDWAQFFEDVSIVDEVLRDETDFAAIDFPTRDLYRHAIEELAAKSGRSELDVTQRVVQTVRDARKRQGRSPMPSLKEERANDVGYHLIAKGRPLFEKSIQCRVSFKDRFFRAHASRTALAYVGTAVIVAAALLAIPLYLSYVQGVSLLAVTAFAIAALIPASDLAVAIVNRLAMKIVGPRLLPKLDFSKGIPADFRTLVVMPVLLVDRRTIRENLKNLEIHYLSHSEGYLQFGLLTDWTDAPTEHAPDDDALLAAAREGIDRLNDLYGPGTENQTRFYLFHRRRVWNAKENAWMGWERKRGKLHELNRLLRGNAETTFMPVSWKTPVPEKIRYVIMLDADTRMSYGTAYRLVGAMAHPLNRPRFDDKTGRVVEGYGVMQPRITPTLPVTGKGSYYQRIFSGPAGIDPYAFAVSDVYQDLFGEGSFTGKGIYDIDAFEASLAGRIPENSVLSHDLLEGICARAGLVTDIEFFEEFPSHYDMAVTRAHRWARGDWQLLPWITGRTLPFIGRWKMFDNLRRSLSAPTLLMTLLLALSIPSAPAGLWMGFLLAAVGFAPMQPFLGGILPRRRRIPIRRHLYAVWADLHLATFHILFAVVFLAHHAALMTDAILSTLYRLAISRRNMLEWAAAAQSKTRYDFDLAGFYSRMLGAPLVALAAVLLPFACATEERFWMGLPLALLWAFSPRIARSISIPIAEASGGTLSAQERSHLRLIARKTWRFFETFVDESQNCLPPDNFQEIPEPVVARRTSPTNIGLYLLSVVSARDFGWIGVSDAVEKLEATLATVKQIAKHRGHLFNWYDTKELHPLEPRYVSTVDSGNLAGHLWAVAHACRQMDKTPLPRADIFGGFADTLFLITETASKAGADLRTEAVPEAQLEEALAALRTSLLNTPVSPDEWRDRLAELEARAVTLIDIAEALADRDADELKIELLSWSELLLRQVRSHKKDCRSEAPTERLRAVAESCDLLVRDMEFGFLFDPVKKIFSIGYLVAEHKMDVSFYDLLTSEARLASFVAIAKGDVPAVHWFRLARSLISVNHVLTLVSWSGSMFEYLMPLLVMRSPANSLLDKACRHAIRRQIAYGAECGVPWGVSESAYNVQNLHHTYQYSNFGVPGLGLKQGLSEDLVIAPYATALAAMVEPKEAVKNFRYLEKMGGQGRFGFFEALDFTPARLPENQNVAVVRAYMAHHQGMLLISLANTLHDGVFRDRFHAEPRVQAGDLLLQERMPRAITVVRVRSEKTPVEPRKSTPLALRQFDSPHEEVPRTHLLSNGRYSVMITSAGSGYSRWRDLAVTRWREDATRDASGTYIFLRDVESGQVWSAGYQPTAAEPESYEVDFSENRAEITRRDGSIETTLEVVVSPEDDAEIRRVTLKNTGGSTRLIDATSYAEIVLAPHAADMAHPAFSNLFVRTEFVPEVNGLLCTRRPRSSSESSTWAGHVLVVEGESVGAVQYESNRTRFQGRGRQIRTPMCVVDGKPLSNNAGAVLDPIVSLRGRLRVPAGETVRATFTTVIASSREAAMGLADKYHDPAMFERTVALAWTHAHIQQHYLGIESGEARLFQDLASRIFYSHDGLRSSQDMLARNTLGRSGLWPHGISGDLPILLVRIDEADDAGIIRDALRAREYWRMKNLAVDLVILNERAHSYSQELQTTLENLVRATQAIPKYDAAGPQGGIFVLRADLLSAEERILLRTAARVILNSHHGSLMQQIARLEKTIDFWPPIRRRAKTSPASKAPAEISKLQFFNGLGGFSPDGSEYVTHLGAGQWTPAPWVNVVANSEFGFQVSESGSGYTWAGNSRENQITPWSNDPVSDPSGEIFYVRDEETGEVWTPTILPIREEAWPYVSRHGQGYSRFEHASHGIALELLQFVPVSDPIKISRLRLTNQSDRRRKLSVTAYVEWVLGSSREANAPFIITEVDAQTNAILARNPWNSEFAQRVAFADLGGQQTAWTADRAEFLGRNGSYDLPAAVAKGAHLSGKSGPGLDPCAAFQRTLELRPGASVDIVFLLGQGADRGAATDLIRRYRAADVDSVLSEVKKQWDAVFGTVQVRTPDHAMDLLLNRWLLYQTLACRVWARSGFYQAGGAYGFRDQLQDVMALLVSRPAIAREHILRAAARQFPEGDVQHWWHPPSGRGVRTRISDDRVWLPYVVTQYLAVTGDRGILEESIPFLDGQAIPEGKEEAYFQPAVSSTSATLFEHCARALDCSLSVGNHGLPLMGTGDWNDGMNRVGHEGKGESVWLAWFLHATLWEFAKVAESLNDRQRAEKWRLHAADLKTAVERHGWDGSWYRRAYFDDGTPLGSAANEECRIDSIAQSWGVLSGAADPARAEKSMASLREHLVRKEDGLVLLLTPPFNEMKPNPGYIQSYLPGIRENGGQYTHAGVWAVLAFAALGDGNSAGELFSLLNPINHASTRADIQRYKVEPYVIAADVYAGSAHTGRGGWTWYTGSAAWMYRAGIEWILGFRLRESTLFIDPCIPSSWEGFELSFLRGSTRYEIKVENPDRVSRGVRVVEMDGRALRRAEGIILADDKAKHLIRVVLG